MGKEKSLLKVAALALEAPPLPACSGAFRVVSLGTEFVVLFRCPSPGNADEPPARPRLLEPFKLGDRELLMVFIIWSRGEVSADLISPPPMGISPDVGVRVISGEDELCCVVGESLPRRSSCVAGDS